MGNEFEESKEIDSYNVEKWNKLFKKQQPNCHKERQYNKKRL